MKKLLTIVAAFLMLLSCSWAYRDLETGTFITRDPTGFVDGPNLYAYVVQNPWTTFDPDGLAKLNKDVPTNGAIQSRVSELDGAISKNKEMASKIKESGDTSADSKKALKQLGESASKMQEQKEFLVKVLEVRDRLGNNGYGEWTTDGAIAQTFGAGYDESVRSFFISEDSMTTSRQRQMFDLTASNARFSLNATSMAFPLPLKIPAGFKVGRVGLDTNALIAVLERGGTDAQAVMKAIGGRIPTVSITAVKEFLRGGGDINALRAFLQSQNGAIGKAATSQTIGQLTGAGLKAADASVVGSAIQEGGKVLTRDKQILSKVPGAAEAF